MQPLHEAFIEWWRGCTGRHSRASIPGEEKHKIPVPRTEIPSLLCAIHQGSPDSRAGGTDSTLWWVCSRCLQGGEKPMVAMFENIYSIQHSSQPVPCLPYFVPLATSHLNLIHHLPRLLSFAWMHEVLRSHVSLYMFFSLRMPSPTFLHNQSYSFS